jgi:anti-sigma-K factor RskA
MTTTPNALEREEIEQLLPWHAAGTLSRRDAQRVEQALQNDADLARQYTLVREEFSETIHLNETLGAPSSRAMERLLAGIEAERGPQRQPRASVAFSTWLAERLVALSPRKLAYVATAAVVLIAIQAGVLGGLYVADRSGGASFGLVTKSDPTGSFAQVGFNPQATAEEITKFLEANKVAVVDGPRPNGLYRVRIAVPKDQVAAVTGRLAGESGIVRFIAAEQ